MIRLLRMQVLIGAMALAATGWSDSIAAGLEEGRSMTVKSIEETLLEYTDTLMAIPGMVGVAQGLLGNTPCIRVFVIDKTPPVQAQIPRVLHGHPVVVEPTGEIRALPKAR
jgi:hypothetical protein